MRIITEWFLRYKEILIVVLVSLVAGFALLHPGLPPTHDGEYHVIRFYEFDKALRDGNLYPRWAPDLNNGFGVPLFNYVYPLPNYIASVMHFTGISFIDAFKLNMFFASLIGSFFFYLWSKKYWGNLGGVVSSIFYSFAPYRFLDIYIRGSVGEVWALAFFPGLLWSFSRYTENLQKRYVLLSSLFIAALIFSHNILGLFFFIFFVSYTIFNWCLNKKIQIRSVLLMIFIGLGLSSPFWLPALIETKYVVGLQITNIADNFPEIYQLIIPSWGSGFSGGDLKDQMSFQIGLANLLVIFIATFGIFTWSKKYKFKKIIIFFLLWFYLILFLLTSYSSWIWDNFPMISYAQFPWRLLSFEIIIAPFLAGSLLSIPWVSKSKKKKTAVALFLIAFVLSLGINYAKPAFYHYRDDAYYVNRSNFIDGTNSVGNIFNTKWLDKIPTKRSGKIEILEGDGKLSALSLKSSEYTFSITAKSNLLVLVNTAYFPGWIGKIDDKKINVENKNGIIAIRVPVGNHNVQIIFQDTFIRKLSYVFFYIAIFTLLIISLRNIDIIEGKK